ncbi:hypothetical protein CDD83_4468 [Cordyceps sp. RAO-2017]|nr:hypothetical protein CDD83_4468 [Cordyceps sp. RAO-2017]
MDDQASSSHDMAAQQEAAKDYQPVLEGPLVGDKTPSSAIAHEYAKADQIYVAKTAALPQLYSHYRPIQGDGNCGWRAIGFSYLEKLIETGDQGKIEGEVARLMSFNHALTTVGGYTYFEEWADEMIGLLRELASSVATLDASSTFALLQQRWNDRSVEGGLIYYLRLLAATYLKLNAAAYDPFVPDGQGILSYCSQSVEIPNREIEHLGIEGLVNVLLKPANITLEIAYLDRSVGSEVNHHRFSDDTPGQQPSPAGSTIYLLYRPDHYDILYRGPLGLPLDLPQDLPEGMRQNLTVERNENLSSHMPFAATHAYSADDFSKIVMIPNMSSIPSMTNHIQAEAFPPAQQNAWGPPSFADDVRGPPASRNQIALQPASMIPSALPPNPSPLGSVSHALMGAGMGLDAQKRATPLIRFSPVQLEYEESKNSFRESTFQVKTNTFKNSVWNRAHYGNPDFHPEEWSPDDENVDGRAGRGRKGRKEH